MTRIIGLIALKLAAIAGVFKRRKLRQIFQIACSVFFPLVAVIYVLPGMSQTTSSSSVCARPTAGSIVKNPPEIRNPNVSNPANFTVLKIAPGQNCYQVNGNLEAPTLRLSPGKEDLVLRLTNRLTGQSVPVSQQTLCVGGMAPPNSTSLHYHGLNVSPQCHQDEVVKTVIKPNETFEFKIQIPKKEPPGLYWYHPHVHMQSEEQVLSGLTGAIIVEGIGSYNTQAAKLPERVFVLRDMELSKDFPTSDTAQPDKDISINSVPIRYLGGGKYDPPAVIEMQPNQEQFWRVANTASDTYLDLQVQYDGKVQPLKLVARDGVPINVDGSKDYTLPVFHILLPPAGRAEFIIKGPGVGVLDAKFLTLNYDTGTQGDNDPQRTIAKIDTQAQPTAAALSQASVETPELTVDLTQVLGDRFSGLSQWNPIQQRTLYFSETDPSVTPSQFYITVLGNKPKVYDPNFKTPDVTVQEGTTEDWTIENRSQEAHAFHMHQIHFLVLESSDASEIGMMRDTINLPAWNGAPKTPFPSVKLRMDFRGAQQDTSIAGTFVYHCHILEHEDKGMMAPIEVKSL
ncbi:MAG: multicopper oxidase domain-containing protein [Stigonema ocellatum SAG 48.90 = DSM 106950]|nr:multicopper oxidase domain-containing protein [Stigonema ocellatum SAG 48.90 = DSM 106950]